MPPIVISSILLLLACTTVQANEYLVPRLGLMSVNMRSTTPIISTGLYYGYQFSRHFSMEMESSVGVSGGEYRKSSGGKGKLQIWAAAGYLAHRWRFSRHFYLKSRAGPMFESVTSIHDDFKSIHPAYGFSGGLGLGFQGFDGLTLETEVTMLEKNIVNTAVGIHYDF